MIADFEDKEWYNRADGLMPGQRPPGSGIATEQTGEREPESAGWLASLGDVNSRPRYPKRYAATSHRSLTVWQRARWHECASELAQVSLRFRRAYWGIRSKGWPRHPDDEREMIEASVQGVEILRSLALAVRSEQDFGLIPPDQSTVGALKKKDATKSDATTTKQQGGYKSMLKADGFGPLQLRQALNKIAHADPTKADFYVAPMDQSHDLLLFGEDRGSQWFAAVSILELIRVVEALPDAQIQRAPTQ